MKSLNGKRVFNIDRKRYIPWNTDIYAMNLNVAMFSSTMMMTRIHLIFRLQLYTSVQYFPRQRLIICRVIHTNRVGIICHCNLLVVRFGPWPIQHLIQVSDLRHVNPIVEKLKTASDRDFSHSRDRLHRANEETSWF